MPETTTVFICSCAFHETLDAQQRDLVAAGLAGRDDVDLVEIDDLCRMAAEEAPKLRDIVQNAEECCFVACYPRAIRSLLEWAGAKLDWEETHIYNLRTDSAEDVLAAFGIDELSQSAEELSVSAHGQWEPWFPVIDFSRCNHCRQCLSFCLFDVYELDEDKKVTVARPENCKNNCPACARVCPEVAIIFPKLHDKPVNGAEIEDELIEREKAKIALEQSRGVDIMSILAQRNRQTRKGLLKDDVRRDITEGPDAS